jgi:hypothetical protein
MNSKSHQLGFFVATCIGLMPMSTVASQAFDLTVRGSSCKQNSQGSLLCSYVIGKDLEISITAAGEEEVGISFLRSNIAGDYYGRFGTMHGCVIVAEGVASAQRSKGPSDFAFISPKNGRVYRTWQECKAA